MSTLRQHQALRLLGRMFTASMLISTVAMAMLWISGSSGFPPAMEALVAMSQPHANPLSVVAQSIFPMAFEHPASGVLLTMACAWVQIAAVTTAVIAAAYGFVAWIRS